ncbi:MAG TPA: hypothetical protein VM094_06235 [Gemmatimonadales bacterium]|nr:hypothetical protein [Gemmatimonadales bacterium]
MRCHVAGATAVFEGGLHRLESLPGQLAREMYQVGNRPGHYQAFMSLVHHWPAWEAVRQRYRDIDCPGCYSMVTTTGPAPRSGRRPRG